MYCRRVKLVLLVLLCSSEALWGQPDTSNVLFVSQTQSEKYATIESKKKKFLLLSQLYEKMIWYEITLCYFKQHVAFKNSVYAMRHNAKFLDLSVHVDIEKKKSTTNTTNHYNWRY
jgi:hypothetical protein